MAFRTIRTLIISIALIAISSCVFAASPVIFVSNKGNDANDGTRAKPVKTLVEAYLDVSAGGIIFILTPDIVVPQNTFIGIGKSVTIEGVTGDAGIVRGVFNIGAGNIKVTLKNLHFVGDATGGPASLMNISSGNVTIDDCSFHVNNATTAIRVVQSSNLTITHSTFNGAFTGIAVGDWAAEQIATGNVVISDSTIEACHRGVWLEPNSTAGVAVSNDVISNCDGSGVFGEGNAVQVKDCELTGCNEALVSDTACSMDTYNDLLTHNTVAAIVNGASSITLADDDITLNGTGLEYFTPGTGFFITFNNNRILLNQASANPNVNEAFE